MPSTPKIPRELILEHALQILIRDGYSALNITSIAKEIGCSTQPISWHVGNMDGLRSALSGYARDYAVRKLFRIQEDAVLSFLDLGMNYLDIALLEPNLFRYIFMNDCGGYVADSIRDFSDVGQNAVITEMLSQQLGIPKEEAGIRVQDLTVYVHGLASYISTGVVQVSKEEAKAMLLRVGTALFTQSQNNSISGV